MTKNGHKPRMIAITSGKGGTGKTNVAVNLALSLRLLGVQVLLLDADMGLGNVDVLLGLRVRHDLRDVLLHGKKLEEVIVEGPRGLKILPGASGVEAMSRLPEERVKAFLEEIERYCSAMDYVVVDTAPGISSTVINCLLAANDIVLVTNTEPTALTDAYGLLKVLSAHCPDGRKSVLVVMNQTSSKEEALGGFDRLRRTAKRFLGWDLEYLGSVCWDEAVSLASKRQVDFLTHYASAPCSRDIRKLAARLVSGSQSGQQDLGRFFRKMMEPADE